MLLPRGPGAPVGLRGAGPERGRERDAVAVSRPALVRGPGAVAVPVARPRYEASFLWDLTSGL